MSAKLDALVAERVLGWAWWSACGKSHLCPPFAADYPMFKNNTHFRPGKRWEECPIELTYSTYKNMTLPRPSTSIADAWQVVEKMRSDGWCYDADDTTGTKDEPHTVRFGRADNTEWDYTVQNAATFPLAVCKAALRACGVDEATIEEACK